MGLPILLTLQHIARNLPANMRTGSSPGASATIFLRKHRRPLLKPLSKLTDMIGVSPPKSNKEQNNKGKKI